MYLGLYLPQIANLSMNSLIWILIKLLTTDIGQKWNTCRVITFIEKYFSSGNITNICYFIEYCQQNRAWWEIMVGMMILRWNRGRKVDIVRVKCRGDKFWGDPQCQWPKGGAIFHLNGNRWRQCRGEDNLVIFMLDYITSAWMLLSESMDIDLYINCSPHLPTLCICCSLLFFLS